MILIIENSDDRKEIPLAETLYSMCEHYIECLDIGKYKITLHVVLHDTEDVEGLHGYCDWDVTDKLSEIHLAMKGPAWGITLAHEMVHVQQNILHGMTAEGPAYDLEYDLFNSWRKIYEPDK